MTKQEAVKLMVEREFHSVPTEWVKIVAEKSDEEIYRWPMWGTMWFTDDWIYKQLAKQSHVVEEEDDEMYCQRQLDSCSNVFLYEVNGEYLIGIHGAGFSFYDYIWPAIYETLELKWHDDEVVVMEKGCTGDTEEEPKE